MTILNYKQAHKSYNEAEDDDVTDSDYDYDDNSITEYDSKMFKRSVGLSKDEKEMLAHFGDDEDDESEEEDEDEFEEDVDSDAFNPGFVDHERHRRNTIF